MTQMAEGGAECRINGEALRQPVMDEHQAVLNQRTALLPTGIPNGSHEALRSIRSGRQTHQVQQRIRHEDQTPMFSNGFGTPHPILVEAQVPLAVLIERFRRPPLQVQADDLGGAPVHPVRDQDHRAARQGLMLETHHDANLAQTGNADAQRKAPVRMHSYFDRTIGIGRNQRHELPDRDVGAWQLQRPAVGIPQVNAGRFQQPVRFQQANPVLSSPLQASDQLLGQVPRVEHHDTERNLMPDGRLHQFQGQGNFGPKLRMPRLKLGGLEQHGVDLLMQAVPRFFVGGELEVRKVLRHSGFPLRQLLIAPVQTQVQREARRATDVAAGDGVMR
jgi:hypothetical protein